MMQIVIEIPEDTYKATCNENMLPPDVRNVVDAIKNGTPLPKGHGRLIDADRFLKRVKKDREHEAYMHSWTADNVLERLDSWYAPTIIEADKAESAEWVDDKCSACGKGIEDLIDSSEWYRNENPKYCPFCGMKIQPHKDRK